MSNLLPAYEDGENLLNIFFSMRMLFATHHMQKIGFLRIKVFYFCKTAKSWSQHNWNILVCTEETSTPAKTRQSPRALGLLPKTIGKISNEKISLVARNATAKWSDSSSQAQRDSILWNFLLSIIVKITFCKNEVRFLFNELKAKIFLGGIVFCMALFQYHYFKYNPSFTIQPERKRNNLFSGHQIHVPRKAYC